MFQPKINRPRVKQSPLSSLSQSEPDLRPGPGERRARWSVESGPGVSVRREEENTYLTTSTPPTSLTSTRRLWEESARSVVRFSPSGRHVAVTGARNTVQVVSSSLTGEGQTLLGHTAALSSLDWARSGSWLVTAGQDSQVKIWDWRSRRVLMEVNSRQGGQSQENYGAGRRSREGPGLFSDPVNMSRFFYMDNILLTVSGNRLAIHSLKLADSEGESSHYRLSKMVSMKNCKTVTSLSCVNQFYSFLTLLSCSDRSVRVYDLNQARVVREIAQCHSRQGSGHSSHSH